MFLFGLFLLIYILHAYIEIIDKSLTWMWIWVLYVDGNSEPQNQCAGEDADFQIRRPLGQGVFLLISRRCCQDLSIFTRSIS